MEAPKNLGRLKPERWEVYVASPGNLPSLPWPVPNAKTLHQKQQHRVDHLAMDRLNNSSQVLSCGTNVGGPGALIGSRAKRSRVIPGQCHLRTQHTSCDCLLLILSRCKRRKGSIAIPRPLITDVS